VVAGESANDREVLRCFLEAFCPQMQGRIVFLNDRFPLREATEATLNDRVRRFASLVRARAERERASVAAVSCMRISMLWIPTATRQSANVSSVR
jgi:hypothetical protein